MDNTATAGLSKLRDLYAKLGARYVRLEDLASLADDELFLADTSVSQWSVAKQAHHIAVATGLMLSGVERIALRKAPATESGSINAMGRMLLTAGRLPRGKAKAPARTLPPETLDRADVAEAIRRSRLVYDQTDALLSGALESGWRVEHPYFGSLNVKQWLKLASIHADHHFRIIDDIRDAR